MIGINGKPFIDLSSIIDISILDLDEIEVGIALSNKFWGYFGKGTNPTEEKLQRFHHYINPPTNTNPAVQKLWQDLCEKKPGAMNAWRWYAKIAYGVYSPSTFIMLRSQTGKYQFERNDDPLIHVDTANYALFPSLKRLVNSNIFSGIGRIIVYVQEHDAPIPLHSDLPNGDYFAPNTKAANSEFIWISPRSLKSFYIYDDNNAVKHPVNTSIAWFNQNDKHGGDPIDRTTWSIRIDGKFSPELREKINVL